MTSFVMKTFDGIVRTMKYLVRVLTTVSFWKGLSPRRAAVVTSVIMALVLAQLIVGMTHAPGCSADNSVVTHHGHSHGDEPGDFIPGHDAADHEHQLNALIIPVGEVNVKVDSRVSGFADRDGIGHIRAGPRRPPRSV